MADNGEIDLIAGQKAFEQVDALIAKVTQADEVMLKLANDALLVNKNINNINSPKGLNETLINNKKLADEYLRQEALIKDLQKQIIALNNARSQSNTVIIKQVQTQNALNKSTSSQTNSTREQTIAQQILRAETDRNFRANTLLAGAYARASAQLLILKKEAKDAAIAFGEESVQAQRASKAALELDQRIKSADKSAGDFQRNVGNYGNAFTKGLGSAFSVVRQLAYILPGLGIAGVLAFATDPLFNYIKGVIGVKEATEQEKKAIEDKVKAQEQAASKLAGFQSDEISRSKILLENAKNLLLPYEKRLKAVNELQQRYPDYLGSLSKEQILAGDTANAEEKLNDALIKRGIALASQQLIQEAINDKLKNQQALNQKLTDIYAEQAKKGKELQKYDPFSKDESYKAKYQVIASRLENLSYLEATLKEQYKDKNKLIEETIKYYIQQYNVNAKYIYIVKEEDKVRKNSSKIKAKLTFDEVKSEYDLKIAILERQKVQANDRSNNENSSLNNRLKARQEFSEKSIELLDLELQKSKAIFEEKAIDDINKNNLAYKNKELTLKEWSKNLSDITNRLNNELETSNHQYSLRWNDLLNSDAQFYKKIEDEKREYTEKTRLLIIKAESEKFKKVSDNESATLTTRQKAFEEYLKLARKELEIAKIRELANAKSPEQIDEITQRYADLNRQLNEIVSPTVKAQEATDKWIKSISEGKLDSALKSIGLSSIKMFLDFDAHGQTTYSKLLAGATSLKEKLAITFQGIADIAKEAFAIFQQTSTERFEAEREALENQKDLSLEYAGDSAAGRAEIERQYQKEQKAIKQREAKAQKKQAEFNIAINTAQGIVAALASTPPNVPLSIAIGIIGLAQLAAVSAKELPQYKTGTQNHKGGLMMINDGSGPDFRETVVTPDGNIMQPSGRNVIMNAKPGTKVFTNQQWKRELDSILFGNNISYSQQESQQAVSDEQINRIVSAIENKTEFRQTIDKSGFRQFMSNSSTETENHNNKINGIGKLV